jgi:hypothetical protein
MYMEYCHLFNVPVPAEKGQIGKYINEKYHISSAVTRENNQGIRYYPGLWIVKSAKLAYAELTFSYSSNSLATDKQQIKEGKTHINSLLATVATDEWPKWVIEEIELMYDYIQSCDDSQKISYNGYLQKAVATVAEHQQIVIPEKSAVAESLQCCCADDVDGGYESASSSESVMSKIDRPTPAYKEDPERERFKAKVQTRNRNTCRSCGNHFEIPLRVQGMGGYICEPCRRDGVPPAPAQVDSQQTLSEVVSAT